MITQAPGASGASTVCGTMNNQALGYLLEGQNTPASRYGMHFTEN